MYYCHLKSFKTSKHYSCLYSFMGQHTQVEDILSTMKTKITLCNCWRKKQQSPFLIIYFMWFFLREKEDNLFIFWKVSLKLWQNQTSHTLAPSFPWPTNSGPGVWFSQTSFYTTLEKERERGGGDWNAPPLSVWECCKVLSNFTVLVIAEFPAVCGYQSCLRARDILGSFLNNQAHNKKYHLYLQIHELKEEANVWLTVS